VIDANVWLKKTSSGEKIIVIGAGSLGKLTVDCILRNKDYLINNVAILDDNPEVQGDSILGVPVIGSLNQVKILSERKDVAFVIAIANNKVRKKIVNESPFLNYTSVISREAIVSPFFRVGKGSVILPGVVVDPEVNIMEHVIINKLSTIAHDVVLHDFSQVSPGVNLGGFIELGECSFIGLGAAVLPFVKITESVVIGAGAVVTKNIEVPYSVFVGNPAKLLKKSDH